MINLPTTGLSNERTNTHRVTNDRESDSTNSLHENKSDLKTYPQRNNRAKLNYRDLERGMYEEIRQSLWASNSSALAHKNQPNNIHKSNNHIEVIDLSIDDDDDDDDVDDTNCNINNENNKHNNEAYRRLCCICNKPWDYSRFMLRCNSCTHWYHGDCIGITRRYHRNDDQFVCSSCQDVLHTTTNSIESSTSKTPKKRKLLDDTSTTTKTTTADSIAQEIDASPPKTLMDESRKKSKTSVIPESTSSRETKIRCIVHDCKDFAITDWAYCSLTCIHRHINDTLQAMQQNKRKNKDELPTRKDILLYESKTKKFLEKSNVPNIEDLYIWISKHPSYVISQLSVRQAALSKENQFKDLTKSSSSVVKPCKTTTSSSSTVTNEDRKKSKLITNKITPVKPKKSGCTVLSTNRDHNVSNIRSKVPTVLYDKILMRLEKDEDNGYVKDDIRKIVHQIEEEMFRVYGKIDNSYKNKFRSLLANITNTNNNFFYKRILSKELSAKQIVAMKAEDMLPPEEKEKRKDQFEREVQMIIDAEKQNAEAMARRARLKATQQGLVENDIILPTSTLDGNNVSDKASNQNGEDIQTTDATKTNIETEPKAPESVGRDSNSLTFTANKKLSEKIPFNNQQISSKKSENIALPSKQRVNPEESSKHSSVEQSNPCCSTDDQDNDYIEPESPTGADAIIYDEEDNEDYDFNNVNHPMSSSITSTSSTNTATADNDDDDCIIIYPPMVREDYNPSKVQNEVTPIPQLPPPPFLRLPNQWHGAINTSDTKIPCQSIRVYGDGNYLVENIPEQLSVLGRVRLHDLWSYIRDALAVRDIIMLTLISSSVHKPDDDAFAQYANTLDKSGRAVVINKCSGASVIRDMYILAANTNDCPSNVLMSFCLPKTFESQQLYLVIIGTGKRTMQLTHCFNDGQLLSNLTYNPISIQQSTSLRDPRLLKSKELPPSRNSTINENITLNTFLSMNANLTALPCSNDDLVKLSTDALERIRQSIKSDDIRAIATSIMEVLKIKRRDDLLTQFTNNLRVVLAEWQTKHGTSSISITSLIDGDNLIEENMDVDDDQDDKHKKQTTTNKEVNNDHTATALVIDDHKKTRRKSRFSDRLPGESIEPPNAQSSDPTGRISLNRGEQIKEKTLIISTKSQIATTEMSASKSINKCINTSFHNNFQSIINSPEAFPISANKTYKQTSRPTRFSYFKDARYLPTPTILSMNKDHACYNAQQSLRDFVKPVKSSGFQGLSASEHTYTDQRAPASLKRPSTTFSNTTQQQRSYNRNSYISNAKRSTGYNSYMKYYHDFDQPQE